MYFGPDERREIKFCAISTSTDIESFFEDAFFGDDVIDVVLGAKLEGRRISVGAIKSAL